MMAFLRQTRVRLALAYASVFGVVALAAAAAVWVALVGAEYSALDQGLAAEARAIRASVELNPADATLPDAAAAPPDGALLFEADGRLVATAGQPPRASALTAVVRQAAASRAAVVVTQSVDGASFRLDALGVVAAAGGTRVLVVTRPMAEADQFLSTAAAALVAGLAVLVVAATVIGYGLAGTALRPVREMAAEARSISERDLRRRITMDLPPDELGDLARTFNEMLARLELAFDSLRRFTADAAHELRAPLTLIRTEAEVALRRGRTAEEYQASLATVLSEAERLSRLADQLLLLAQADAGALRPHLEPLDLAALSEEVVALWRVVAARRDIAIESELPALAPLRGDRDLLRRLLDNLVDNALRHAPAASVINLTCHRVGDEWEVVVADGGPGVPPELRGRLFERFARGDSARRRETGGAGLGLALCAAIAQLHRGSIELDEDAPGARFVVRLPATHGESPPAR